MKEQAYKPYKPSKKVNAELVRFAAKAKEQGMTYGQLQARETLNKLKEQREKEKRKAERIEWK